MKRCRRSAIVVAGLFIAVGCDGKGASSGAGGAAGQATTGGVGGSGGGAGGNASGGASGGGGTVADASVLPSGDGSLGCGVTGAATGVLSAQTITVGDRERTYVLSVPKTYSDGTPLPLVFAWHGMGGTGTMARQYFGIESASNNGAIFVYPDGLPTGGGDGGTGWDLSTTGIDFAFFDALLAKLSASYCIDRNRVFSAGHSFGAMITNYLGCYRGDVLRAIAPVAGMPPSAFGRGTVTCVGQVGAIIIHGENDTTVDYTTGGIASRDFWAKANGCATSPEPIAITPSACVEYQGCQPDLPLVWCVHTQGHNWPTTRNCGDGGICFDGGAAVWAFFARFQ
jgi:poly(3-hydroxybutyrate) depolymerase